MNILLLRGFNNYFNRVVKKYSTLSDYRNNSASYLDLSSINFNPNDGVVTELIIGSTDQKENNAPLAWDEIGTPDYCICYENNTIKFRWFVLESERTRKGQYRIALKRDVVAENFDKVMTAPCFVEKGSIASPSNPLLFNNESLTYNQIKKAEYPLKDTTGTAWIVGYMAKNRANTPVHVSTNIAIIDGVPSEYYEEDDLPFEVDPDTGNLIFAYDSNNVGLLLPFSSLGPGGGWNIFGITQGFKALGNINLQCDYKYLNTGRSSDTVNSNDAITDITNWGYTNFTNDLASTYVVKQGTNPIFSATPVASTAINVFSKKYLLASGNPADSGYNTNKVGTYSDFLNASVPASDLIPLKNILLSYMATGNFGPVVFNVADFNGKYVKIGSNYYRMSFNQTNRYRSDVFIPTATAGTYPTIAAEGNNIAARHFNASLNNVINKLLPKIASANPSLISTSSSALSNVQAVAVSKEYSVVLSRTSTETLDVTLNTGKRITYDCPADIFAIPYGTFKFKTTEDGDTYTTQKEEGLALARAIAKELGSSVCYDLQLLPYVPSQLIRDLMTSSDTLTLTDLETVNYDIATKTYLGDTTTATFLLYPSSCKGTFDIDQIINKYNNQLYSEALNTKISNEVQLCRLVSPNFNGMFEFSLAKNNGVSKFNVDYTYKPLMPYIHINPDFKFIYGQDWDDARGLILGGDFSLTFINDAWVTYENNNKNYQAIFNRQIENMDVNNQIAREQQDWQRVAGYFGGGISGGVGGALAGAKVGGPWGAAAGAVGGAYMGTVGAIIGGEMDREWLQRQQAETKDYTTDMYGYQLGNIKAMPYSLSRSESLTNNNKIYPIVELYEPTEIEIENLVNKLNYNGMTIMAIGELTDYAHSADFQLTFVKGQLIRLDNLDDDFHVADAIYQEVNKGFYIPQGE